MRRIVLVAALTSCYQPAAPAGAQCASMGQCPPGLSCVAGVCTSGDGGGGDGGRGGDAGIDADPTCACDGDSLSCASGSTACALGCSSTGGPHCMALVPSNSVPATLVNGTTATSISALTTFDTDTGAITGDVTRDAGIGVISGIAYAQTASLGEFAFQQLSIAGTVQVTGTRAAVFLVAGSMMISGIVDVSAGCYGMDTTCAGPGGGSGSLAVAPATGCGAAGLLAGGVETIGGGGGGGGGGSGASGGAVSGIFGSPAGAAGDACAGAGTLEPLVGGGGGGAGFYMVGSSSGGGGGGGGALQLTALGDLTITGTISAGGAGGDPSVVGSMEGMGGAGAGGGGAGGSILLESIDVSIVDAVVVANGGGGGGASAKTRPVGRVSQGSRARRRRSAEWPRPLAAAATAVPAAPR